MVLDRAKTGLSRLRLDPAAIRAWAGDALVLMGTLALVFAYLSPGFPVKDPQPNAKVFLVSVGIITLSLLFLGWQALRVTVVDYWMMGWAVLVVASQAYAMNSLGRSIGQETMVPYMTLVIANWGSYRAAYALVRISPSTAPRTMIAALVGGLLFTSILGILQIVGPVKTQVIALTSRLGNYDEGVLDLQNYGRASSVFNGPNFLGYANVVGACAVIALNLTNARKITVPSMLLTIVSLGIFSYSTLLAQSRIALFMLVLVIATYGLWMRRAGTSNVVLLSFAALTCGVGMAAVLLKKGTDLSYLDRTFQTNITQDESFRVRALALEQFGRLAPELAPLGSGVGQVNGGTHIMREIGFDYYWAIGNDNEWANAYLAHGVWGPLLIGIFYWIVLRMAFRAYRSPHYGRRLLGVFGVLFLVVNLLLSPTGVRILKQTGFIMCFSVGAIAGLDVPRSQRRKLAASA